MNYYKIKPHKSPIGTEFLVEEDGFEAKRFEPMYWRRMLKGWNKQNHAVGYSLKPATFTLHDEKQLIIKSEAEISFMNGFKKPPGRAYFDFTNGWYYAYCETTENSARDYGGSMKAWLEIKTRSLPLLQHHFLAFAGYYPQTPLYEYAPLPYAIFGLPSTPPEHHFENAVQDVNQVLENVINTYTLSDSNYDFLLRSRLQKVMYEIDFIKTIGEWFYIPLP